MKEELGGYETRLLAELTEVVEKRAASRFSWFTMPKLAVGGVALAALAVTGGLTLPVFGGASERSPDDIAVSESASGFDVQTVGYSVAADDGRVWVTITDPEDAEGLEAALAAKGIPSNVTYLPGRHHGCTWPGLLDESSGADGGLIAWEEHEDGTQRIELDPEAFAASGGVLMIAWYTEIPGPDSPVQKDVPAMKTAVLKSDLGECIGY